MPWLFSVAAKGKSLYLGAGRSSWYPQNNATASTLASDKNFTSKILVQANIPTLGGEYFFLNDRHRAHRPAGHERDEAVAYFGTLGASAFLKPLSGSRGDFAQAVDSEASLLRYLGDVSKYYDAVKVLHFLLPLLVLNLGLVGLGGYLIIHSVLRIRHFDRQIQELKRQHSPLAEFID